MAQALADRGRDLALCARRTDRLEELKAELVQRYPNITVAVAELDVNDHEKVPVVFAALAEQLGGLDRVIVNAGVGKGAPLGSRGSCGPTRPRWRPILLPHWCRSNPPWRSSRGRGTDIWC